MGLLPLETQVWAFDGSSMAYGTYYVGFFNDNFNDVDPDASDESLRFRIVFEGGLRTPGLVQPFMVVLGASGIAVASLLLCFSTRMLMRVRRMRVFGRARHLGR